MKFKADRATVRFAKDALMVQNACNPTGVVASLVRNMESVRESQPKCDLAQHPATYLFLDKLHDLNRRSDLSNVEVVKGDDPLSVAQEFRDKLFAARQNEGLGTEETNRHPIMSQYLKKLFDMSGEMHYGKCYFACDTLEVGQDAEINLKLIWD